MADKELDGAMRSFIKTIVVALSDLSVTTYETTVLSVTSQGDLHFDLIVGQNTVGILDRASLAFEFGKSLALEYRSMSMIIVGEEFVDNHDVPWIVITGASIDGSRRSCCMQLMRLPDGTIRSVLPERINRYELTEKDCHMAAEVLRGVLAGQGP